MKIGKERERLKAVPVEIKRVETERVEPKVGGKFAESKDKIVLYCKHPDSKENIKLSTIRFEKAGKMVQTALWLTLDEDGNISYESSLAYFLRFLGLDDLDNLFGKKINTTIDAETKFLVIKGY